MSAYFTSRSADRAVPGHHDRPGSCRRQRHRHRTCRRGPAATPARQGDLLGHRRRDADAHRLCQRHDPAASDHRPAAGRRHPAAVGVLEDVARVARDAHARMAVEAATGHQISFDAAEPAPTKTFGQAIWQIIVADVSMSLDNVLAVAGAARNHPYILVFGLGAVDRADGRRRELHREACCRSIAGSPTSASPSSSTWRWTCATAARARCGLTPNA